MIIIDVRMLQIQTFKKHLLWNLKCDLYQNDEITPHQADN